MAEGRSETSQWGRTERAAGRLFQDWRGPLGAQGGSMTDCTEMGTSVLCLQETVQMTRG